MKLGYAKRNCLLFHDDGRIHYPYSKFLNDKFSNPHTLEKAAQALRILSRFCNSHEIELLLRAYEGRCLSYDEAKKLCELCYRPLDQLEAMGDKKVVLITSPKAGRSPSDLPGAVEKDTVKQRLFYIASYLNHYREVFLEPNIRSSATREQLKTEYDKVSRQLRRSVRGKKMNHHLTIKSLPTDKYLSIIEAVFVRPHDLFQTAAGKPSSTLLRDRAMALLACEGLRPGTLGNIALANFLPSSEMLAIEDNRAKRSERVTTKTPKLKLGDSTLINSASETTVKLWPFTVRAIRDYIETERDGILNKRLNNRTKGFLFLSNAGEPIKHRGTITAMFNKLGKRLAALGLLDIGDDPYFEKQEKYDFYGYVLRHSAASFFLNQKCIEDAEEKGIKRPHDYKDVPDAVKGLMRQRFGWVPGSNMPELYAARALSDNANVVLMDFNQDLLNKAAALKKSRDSVSGV